jgi:hypothetical protein
MKVIQYATPQDIQLAAIERRVSLLCTDTSLSFRIFDEHGRTVEFHVFKKPNNTAIK